MLDMLDLPKPNKDIPPDEPLPEGAFDGLGLDAEDEAILDRARELAAILAPNGSDDPEAVQGIIAEILAKDDEVQARDGIGG